MEKISHIQVAQYLGRRDREIAEKLFCENGVPVIVNFSRGKKYSRLAGSSRNEVLADGERKLSNDGPAPEVPGVDLSKQPQFWPGEGPRVGGEATISALGVGLPLLGLLGLQKQQIGLSLLITNFRFTYMENCLCFLFLKKIRLWINEPVLHLTRCFQNSQTAIPRTQRAINDRGPRLPRTLEGQSPRRHALSKGHCYIQRGPSAASPRSAGSGGRVRVFQEIQAGSSSLPAPPGARRPPARPASHDSACPDRRPHSVSRCSPRDPLTSFKVGSCTWARVPRALRGPGGWDSEAGAKPGRGPARGRESECGLAAGRSRTG